MKLITKLRKADFQKKTEIFQAADLTVEERNQLMRDIVLSMPKGYYKLHDRNYGTNLVDAVFEVYGLMPSMFVDESLMLGLQALYPKKIYASFTLGLDVVEIK